MPLRLPLASVELRSCPDLRLMLINPPQSYPLELGAEYQSYFPVGIASLGAAVEPTGAELRLLDCLAFDERRIQQDKIWFGMGFRQIQQEIAAFSPHIVGLTNPFSMFVSDTILTAQVVKSVDPDIQVVVGGIEGSVAPNNRRLLERCRAIDLLVKGEGEMTLRDLVKRFNVSARKFSDLENVAGILFRDESGAVVETRQRPWIHDLDALPLPAYHLLDMDRMFANPFYARFRGRTGRCLPIHTSRGCPYSCNFCSVHSQVGKANRRHTPALVAKHIEHVQKTYGVNHIHFEDDNLTLNPKHTHDLFSELEPFGITFDTPNGIRADTVTPEVAQLFKRAGATQITIAVESGVQRILDEVVCKRLDLRDVVTAAAALDAADIPCLAFFIIGFPGETEQDVRATLRFAKDLARSHSTINLLFVANPLPGTPLHRQCEENGYLVDQLNKNTLFRGIRLNQAPLVSTPEFTKRDLFRWAREELAVSDLVSTGQTIPMFTTNAEPARDRLEKVLQLPLSPTLEYPWHRGYLDDEAPSPSNELSIASA